MGADAKTQELRDLVSLARQLRDYAAQTDDAHYLALFQATADMLEARASALGCNAPAPAGQPRSPGP